MQPPEQPIARRAAIVPVPVVLEEEEEEEEDEEEEGEEATHCQGGNAGLVVSRLIEEGQKWVCEV